MKSALVIGLLASLPVLALMISFLAGAMISGVSYKKDLDCYADHVQECINCHNSNLTYLLCSGFCAPPSNEDLSYPGDKNPSGSFCSIHPSEDCFDTIPKECLT